MKNANGILADQVGLRKTVRMIAVPAWLAFGKRIRGPYSIVVAT